MTNDTTSQTDSNVELTNNQRSFGSLENQPEESNGKEHERNALRPPVDVFEDDSGITLFADMPGVAKENLSLKLESDQLVIEGEMSLDIPEELSASRAEMQLARYRRAFALSKELDPDNIEAECRHGVLKLLIPKAKHAQPRKITISVQ